MKNKKAFIISSLMDFWAILTYIIIILVFYLLFKLTGAGITQKIISEDNIVETNMVLINLLKTPVDDKDFTDLIINSISEDDYDDLEIKIKEILDKYYNENYADCCWDFKILHNGEILERFRGSECKTFLIDEGFYKTTIPSPDLKIYDITLTPYNEDYLFAKYKYPYCRRKDKE